MNNSLNIAKQKMLDGKYTCVVLIDNDEYTSYERGVKPLLSLLQTGRSFAGAVAADKCVGAGAAHLYVLLGVCAVWANIISMPAIQVFKNGIEVFFGESVPNIINRRGDGICPTAERIDTLKFDADKYIAAIEKIHPYQHLIKGVHIWGKKKNPKGRWIAHCGTLDTYFGGNEKSKNIFLNGIARICDDGITRFLVPEVNSGAEDLRSIIEDITGI